MGKTRQLASIACLVLVACGSKATESPAEAETSHFSLHEWGLFAVSADSPTTARAATEATGTLHSGHSAAPGSIGLGGLGTLGGKPVIYVHLDQGTDRAEFDLELGLPLSQVLERFPAGGSLSQETHRTSAGWHGVVAERGRCAHPTRPPTADSLMCTGTRDHFCEAAEIGRYAGDRVSCLTVAESKSELLFYRAESLPTAPLPLRLVRDGQAWKVVSAPNVRITGPVFYIETAAIGAPVHIRRLEAADFGRPLPAVTETTVTPPDVRAALLAESMRRGLTSGEADAFVDAWAPAYFDTCRRTGPEASGTPPIALSQVGRSLLYFASAETIDAMLPIHTRPPARETRRVFLVRWVDETSTLIGNDPMVALGQLMGTPIGQSSHSPGPGTLGCAPNCGMVAAGTPQVSRGLAVTVVQRVMRRNINQVRFCYETELRTTPALHGRVRLDFIVRPDGTVGVSRVGSSTLRNPSVERCLEAFARRLNFPAPDPTGPVAIKYPFELERRP